MEPIFTKSIFSCYGRRDGVGTDMFWDCLVELRIEDSDVACRRQGFHAELYDFKGWAIVEGCEVGECFEMMVGFFIYEFGGIVVSSMDLQV